MLHVFLVDSGSMHTFQMELAMESVNTLMEAIASTVGIAEDKQVLLTAGGEALDPTVRVCNYGSVGTDTNPIFLFSKTTIESSVPPSPSLNLGSEASLKEQVEESFHLPSTYETLVTRAQLASEFNQYAKELSDSCELLVNEQRWQQQGWASVVANLESISRDFSSHATSIQQAYSEFLSARQRYVELLTSFDQVIPILGKIPVLPCLLQSQQGTVCPQGDVMLLDWISAQDHKNSLQDMARQSLVAIEQFDEAVLDSVMTEVKQVSEALNNASMKEIKGLDERLNGLQQLLQMVQSFKQSQAEMAQGFQQNQMRAQHLGDPSVLPDLCASHQKQLMMLLKNHSQLRDIRRRCVRAKDELSANLHTRLRWIMYVEKKICDCDSTLIIYHENIRRIKRRLDILEQVIEAPNVYVVTIAEVIRRRMFASQYLKWARTLTEMSNQAKAEEITRREEFSLQYGRHFLQNMFVGLDDRPSKVVEKAPREFDSRLPIITERELQGILEHVPELRQHLETSSINVSMRDVSGRLGTSSSQDDDTDGTGFKIFGFAEAFKSFSVSQTKSSVMSVDTSTQVEGAVMDDMFPTEGEGEFVGGDLTDDSSKGEGKELTYMSVAQDLGEDKEGVTRTKRKSSSEGDSDKNSQGLEDSDLMFKSANEDYVTVYDTDVAGEPSDGKPSGEMVISETSVELCDPPSLEETSQTLTLTNFSSGSGSQSTNQSSQTDFIDSDLLHTPFQESTKRSSHEAMKSGETSDTKTLERSVQNIKHLEEHLAKSKNALESSNRKRDDLLAMIRNLKELLEGELGKTRDELASSKETIEKLKAYSQECSAFILDEVKRRFESEKSTAIESVSKTMREELEQEKAQFVDLLSKEELQSVQLREELEKIRTEKETLVGKHKEETEKLRFTLEDCKTKLGEQQSLTTKQHESKSRFDEDQQIRFNAIITKLKKDKEQAMNQAHEKLRNIEVELAKEREKTGLLTRESENLHQGKKFEAERFCEREKELLAALQKAECNLDEVRCTFQQKEKQFDKRIEEEKSRALLLLEVERQMWEAEKEKEKVAEAEQPEKAVDVALEQEFQLQVEQLQEENRMLQEKLVALDEAEKTNSSQVQQTLAEKGEQIQRLQQQLSQLHQQTQGATGGLGRAVDRTGIVLKDFQQGDLVLLVFDERYENYLMLSMGPTLFFLHPESVGAMDLALTGSKRRPWVLARMTDKEYCQAKKPNNRFKVPVGTKFYRIQARPFERKSSNP